MGYLGHAHTHAHTRARTRQSRDAASERQAPANAATIRNSADANIANLDVVGTHEGVRHRRAGRELLVPDGRGLLQQLRGLVAVVAGAERGDVDVGVWRALLAGVKRSLGAVAASGGLAIQAAQELDTVSRLSLVEATQRHSLPRAVRLLDAGSSRVAHRRVDEPADAVIRAEVAIQLDEVSSAEFDAPGSAGAEEVLELDVRGGRDRGRGGQEKAGHLHGCGGCLQQWVLFAGVLDDRSNGLL
jgi:hypothetical protein